MLGTVLCDEMRACVRACVRACIHTHSVMYVNYYCT